MPYWYYPIWLCLQAGFKSAWDLHKFHQVLANCSALSSHCDSCYQSKWLQIIWIVTVIWAKQSGIGSAVMVLLHGFSSNLITTWQTFLHGHLVEQPAVVIVSSTTKHYDGRKYMWNFNCGRPYSNGSCDHRLTCWGSIYLRCIKFYNMYSKVSGIQRP